MNLSQAWFSEHRTFSPGGVGEGQARTTSKGRSQARRGNAQGAWLPAFVISGFCCKSLSGSPRAYTRWYGAEQLDGQFLVMWEKDKRIFSCMCAQSRIHVACSLKIRAQSHIYARPGSLVHQNIQQNLCSFDLAYLHTLRRPQPSQKILTRTEKSPWARNFVILSLHFAMTPRHPIRPTKPWKLRWVCFAGFNTCSLANASI